MATPEFINIPVPADRVAEVYRLLGQPANAVDAPLPAPPAAVKPVVEQSPAEREEVIAQAYRESAGTGMAAVLDFLTDHAEQAFTMEELAKGINRDARSMGGVFGAFGRRWKNRYGQSGSFFFKAWWSSVDGMMKYKMPQDAADTIRRERGR